MRGPGAAPSATTSGSNMNRRGGETVEGPADRFMSVMFARGQGDAFGPKSKI